MNVPESFCGYGISIVASDLSRQVVAEYDYAPVVGHLSCNLGCPVSLRWEHFLRRWKQRYYRAKPLVDKVKRLGEWENVGSRDSEEHE